MARLNCYSVIIALIGCIGNLVKRNALDNLTLKSDDKMAADIRFPGLNDVLEVAPVLSCRCARITNIVNHHSIDLLKLLTRS